MQARPLHSREGLLRLVRDRAPTRACDRAMAEDRAVVLGGFTPPEGLPYWLVQVTSRFGRTWYIAVHCDEDNQRFMVTHPTGVRWEHWDGRSDGRSLKDGDDPKTFALRRAIARRQQWHRRKDSPSPMSPVT